MTLQFDCPDDGEYWSALLGVGSDHRRTGSKATAFNLCQNHSQVFTQIDRELVEEGWVSAYMGKAPVRAP
jgi:hypothetical protein